MPVLGDADFMSIVVEAAIASFGSKAREKLTIEEMTGGTFTVSNGGVFGRYCLRRFLTHRKRAFSACIRFRIGPSRWIARS